MPVVLKVAWVDQSDEPDVYKRIRQIGGVSGKLQWKHAYSQAIESTDQGQFQYFVEHDSRMLRLEIGEAPDGSKFLKTPTDTVWPELLLSLPQGPRPRASGPGGH
jgi:hypothetical protein